MVRIESGMVRYSGCSGCRRVKRWTMGVLDWSGLECECVVIGREDFSVFWELWMAGCFVRTQPIDYGKKEKDG